MLSRGRACGGVVGSSNAVCFVARMERSVMRGSAVPDFAALHPGYIYDQKNAMVRISMLSRGRACGGVVGSSNAVCAVQRARPSLSESNTLKT